MILQNVLHRPVRTLITVIGIAVEVTLVILVVGLTTGLADRIGEAHRRSGRGHDGSAALGFRLHGLQRRADADRHRRINSSNSNYVQAVAPVLVQFNSVNGLDIVYGIDKDSFRAVSGGFVFLSGHELEGAHDILVDDIYAKGKKIQVGQTLHILETDFHVAGIVEHGKGARLFVLMSTLQEMSGAHDKASIFFIKATAPITPRRFPTK